MVLVIRLVGEAGLFELAVLATGAVLGVLLEGVPRLGCSLGLGSDKHRLLGPVSTVNVGSVRGLVCLGADPGTFGIPTRDIAPAALVTMVTRTPAALARLPSGRRSWAERQRGCAYLLGWWRRSDPCASRRHQA